MNRSNTDWGDRKPGVARGGAAWRRVTMTLAAALASLALAPAAAACTRPAAPEVVAAMLDLINAERRRHGLGSLRHDPELAALAQGHACDMVRNGFFGHVAPGNRDFAHRVSAAGRHRCAMSENLAKNLPSARAAHRAWMGSGGHRDNILHPRHTTIGLGVAAPGDERRTHWVTVFSGPC